MQSGAGNFRRHRTMCGAARRAATHRSAERITSAMFEPTLPFDDTDCEPGNVDRQATPSQSAICNRQFAIPLPDASARAAAVDPERNVILEASAGTGKTRVLVERYVNLLRAGIDPDHILAITFTRKAASEMRDRIIDRLRAASRQSEFDRARWRDLKDRLSEIAISTIDAFC